MLGRPSLLLRPPLPCLGYERAHLGKQRQFVCWIQVKTADGKIGIAKCLIKNGSELKPVRKGFLAKISSKAVQLEDVSGHRLDGGKKEADLTVSLVRQSVWSTEEMKELWLSGTFYQTTIKYDLFLRQQWLIVCGLWGTDMLPSRSVSQRPIRAVLSASFHQKCSTLQGAK